MSKQPPRRTDYWDDPEAPAGTTRKPSASVVLRNHRGELLLLRRADSGRWTIPTGGLKKNETMSACAVRECLEETGLTVELTGLVGVFTDPRHRIAYPDGEVRVPVNVCFHGYPVAGKLATDDESTQAAWVSTADLDNYDVHPSILRRISHALHGTVPHIDLSERAARALPGGSGDWSCRFAVFNLAISGVWRWSGLTPFAGVYTIAWSGPHLLQSSFTRAGLTCTFCLRLNHRLV